MYYSCKQMKAKMLVAHTEPVLVDDSYDWRVRAVRNITVNIGCSCVYRAPVLLDEFFPGPQERKRNVADYTLVKEENRQERIKREVPSIQPEDTSTRPSNISEVSPQVVESSSVHQSNISQKED